jgi:hypothetical protein
MPKPMIQLSVRLQCRLLEDQKPARHRIGFSQQNLEWSASAGLPATNFDKVRVIQI